jgi:branched-chain amino acid transport system ATP-binding protein
VEGSAVPDPVLQLDDLHKNFGGLVVTDGVTLDIGAGELHAVIGPNGAGKTTLINQISGLLAPTAGTIRFDGIDVTALPVDKRAQTSYRFFGRADREQTINDAATSALAEVGLAERGDILAAHLSHGEKRALELAIAIAMQPKLLLLDEPMAGTGHEESARLVDVIKRLKGRFSMLLVEHDMPAVFALADRISVLTYGRILASGTPDAVRADPKVVAAYLGEEME